MRAYLDTNILAFTVGTDEMRSIDANVKDILFDYSSVLLTSNICILELVHLILIGKVTIPGIKDVRKAASAAVESVERLGIKMVSFTQKNVEEMINLPLYDDHRDPNDRMVVAQAVSDHIPLISSDRKFSRYERYGLEFIFNER